MPFLPLFTGIRHLAHVLTVPPNKSVTTLRYTRRHGPVYIQAMPVGTYRVKSPGFPKIVYSPVFINAGQRFGLRTVKMREEQIGSVGVCTH